jgi:putative FmdB family regulatory protein
MPLYEYRCEACGQPEERLEGFSAPEVHECEACGASEGMKRQISVSAFSLKGSGWYQGSPSDPSPKPTTPTPEAPKSGHACGSGGCGCPLAG